MKRKMISMILVFTFCIATLVGCGQSAKTAQTAQTTPTASPTPTAETSVPKETKFKIATVVKLNGVAWFDRMDQGVKKFAEDSGQDAYQVGPQKADAALQVQLIEDLIAQKVDAICVVPFSTEALEPVLKKAMDKGIIVISHEGAGMKNVNYDIEAFDNKAYGAFLMENLAKAMGGKGEYATMVGSVSSKSHVEWVEGAVEYQKEKYPDMKLVADKVESSDDQKKAYEKMKELLKAHPQLKGFQGSSAVDAPGAALAVEEAGLTGKVSVVGTSLPSIASKYLESGALSAIEFWDPSDAGYAMNQMALMMLQKKEIKDGSDLGVSGYNKITAKGNVFYGSAYVNVTKENMSNYDF
ncbi:MAG: substrate-binding domain-containing protein [Ruminiclostridium sp.]